MNRMFGMAVIHGVRPFGVVIFIAVMIFIWMNTHWEKQTLFHIVDTFAECYTPTTRDGDGKIRGKQTATQVCMSIHMPRQRKAPNANTVFGRDESMFFILRSGVVHLAIFLFALVVFIFFYNLCVLAFCSSFTPIFPEVFQ